MRDGESEPIPLPDRLRREERIEEAPLGLGGNTGARIANLRDGTPSVVGVRCDDDLLPLDLAFPQRLRCVHEQIDEHLPELALRASTNGVVPYSRRTRAWCRTTFSVMRMALSRTSLSSSTEAFALSRRPNFFKS